MKIAILLFSFVASLQAQKSISPGRPVTTTPGTITTNPTTSNPNTTNTNNLPNSTNQPGIDTARPVFLSGKVVLDDGTPPPELVRIEKLCGASPRPEGYTDSKGRFSFQLDSSVGVFADASDSTLGGFPGQQRTSSNSRATETSLSGCELRAILPGFRSDSVNLSMHRAFDNPNVGTIVLHRIGGIEGTTISYASLNAPKDAARAYEKGREALKKEKQPEAEKQFRKAVELYPGYATAWYELGRLDEARNQPKEASENYRKSIEADPKFFSPYLSLSNITARSGDWAQTLDLTDRALRLNSIEFPQAYYYNAVANLNLRHLDEAEKSAREAEKLDTRKNFPKLNQLLAAILIEKQDYSGAAKSMRAYLDANPQAKDAVEVRARLAELDKAVASNVH